MTFLKAFTPSKPKSQALGQQIHVAQYGVAVEALQTTNPDMVLNLARGNVIGNIDLEAQSHNGGAVVQLLPLSVGNEDTADGGVEQEEDLDGGEAEEDGFIYTTVTTDEGAYAFNGVVVGQYQIKVSKPNYVSQAFAPVSVLSNETVQVPVLQMAVQKGDVNGLVQVETKMGEMEMGDTMVVPAIYASWFLTLACSNDSAPGEAFTFEGVALGPQTMRFRTTPGDDCMPCGKGH